MLRKCMVKTQKMLPVAVELKVYRTICLRVTFAICFLAGISQNVKGEQSWPSVTELAASGHGWQKLSGLGLSAQQLTGVRSATSAWIEKHCKNDIEKIGTFPAKRIQLRTDGTPQLVIQAVGDWEGDSQSCPCEPNLNCRNWIMDFSDKGANTLLEHSGFGIIVLKSISHGYFDVVTASSTKKTTMEFTMWRFDGKKYQALRCASVRYSKRVMNDPSKIYSEIDRTGVISEHSCP
jgi:hypothetical protein